MKVYDGFIFNDELDLLELRLETLDSVVDRFVLVEMPMNFRMLDKPLHYQENSERFAKWAGKIDHIVVANYPVAKHPRMEHHQRRRIADGFRDAEAGDLLMVGDVDEIPHPKWVEAFRRNPPEHPVTLIQHLYYYHVNRHVHDRWPATVAFPRSCVNGEIDCEKIRQGRFFFPPVPHGGWHFSWLGTEEQLANKLNCIDVETDARIHGSTEITTPDPDDAEFLRRCRESGADLFRRPVEHKAVAIEPGVLQPPLIREWLQRHPQYEVPA